MTAPRAPRSSDPIHVVIANSPAVDGPLFYCGSKSCCDATAREVEDASGAIRADVMLPGATTPMHNQPAVPDGVSLPKTEPGPAGREIGTWHFAADCG